MISIRVQDTPTVNNGIVFLMRESSVVSLIRSHIKVTADYRFLSFCQGPMIGVGKDSRPPRPPNCACGSPAHSSPVGRFPIGVSSQQQRLRAK